jgi:hypothetical protein
MLRAARRATESIPPGNKSLLKSKFVDHHTARRALWSHPWMYL